MFRRFLRPRYVQLVLALAAVAYLASLWLVPQLNPLYGLVLIIALAAAGGLAVFVVSLRGAAPPPLAGRPADVPAAEAPTGPHRPATRPAADANAEPNGLSALAGQPRPSLAHHQQTLAVARQAGDPAAEAAALGQLGRACADLGDWPAAIAHYQQLLPLLRAAGDRAGEARASWDLGLAYEQMDDLPQAITAMQVYVDYQRATGQPDAETAATLLDELRAQQASETTAPAAAPRSPER